MNGAGHRRRGARRGDGRGVGPGWVLAVDAAAFAVAGALRAFLDVESHPAARAPGGGLLADLREGWREFVGRPWLWSIVAQFSVVIAVVGAAESVYGPLVARDSLGGAGPWGLALAAFGAGTVGGGAADDALETAAAAARGTLCVFPFALPPAALAVPVPVVRSVRGDVRQRRRRSRSSACPG